MAFSVPHDDPAEMPLIVAYVLAHSGTYPEASAWLTANSYQGKIELQSVTHWKTCAHFKAPALTDAQIDTAVADARA